MRKLIKAKIDKRKLASVQRICNEWNVGGIPRVDQFLNDKNTIIEPDSFGERIHNTLNEGKKHWISVGAEIKQISENFKRTKI